jgi:putative ABC transport system permease protein
MFAVAGLLSALIAMVTVGFHAVKAAVANPVNSLRAE